MNQAFDCSDMRFMSDNTELKFLNFKEQDIETIKNRFYRDTCFLISNDVTNFSFQLVVELNKGGVNEDAIGYNSFLSVDGQYIYHFCINDFTETYSSLLFAVNPKEYTQIMEEFVRKYVLIQQISNTDRELKFLDWL